MTWQSGRPSAPPTAQNPALSRVAGRAAAALALTLALAAAMPALAGGATTVFNPVADAYVSSSSPNTNYGTSTHLRAQGSSPNYQSYLRFDVQGLTGQVTGAVLRLSPLASQTIDVRAVSDSSWGETTIKYSNAPPVGDVAATSGTVYAAPPQWAAINVTSLVQGNGAVSMALTSPSTSTTLRDFSSRNAGSSKAPQLVVQTASLGDNLIGAAGDIACPTTSSNYNGGAGTATACQQRATSDLLLGLNLAAVLPLGDEQYEVGALSEFQTVYDSTWGRLNALSHPVPGNHEYQASSAASGYFDFFNGAGNPTGIAGERGKGYYSYDLGSWHLIALNSNCSKVGGCGTGSPQEQWLAADLAAHPSSCILAYYHHPNFKSGNVTTTLTPAFWQDLYAAGADVVLNGHAPTYERFARQAPSGAADPNAGIREFVAATGGRYHVSLGTIAPNSGARDNTSFGVLLMTLRPDGYDWRFQAIPGSKFTDVGSDSCTAPTVDTEPPSAPRSLAVTANTVNAVSLKWTASTDNDGVASYEIRRDGVVVGTSRTPTFTDTTVQPGTTYSYRVLAYDAVGNVSPQSSAKSVTTPTG
jgi:acid phosphatase type 7